MHKTSSTLLTWTRTASGFGASSTVLSLALLLTVVATLISLYGPLQDVADLLAAEAPLAGLIAILLSATLACLVGFAFSAFCASRAADHERGLIAGCQEFASGPHCARVTQPGKVSVRNRGARTDVAS